MSSAVLQLHQRESFERNVTRAVLAGAAGGVVHLAAAGVGLDVPLTFLCICGAALATVRGDRFDRLLLIVLSLLCPALPWFFGMSEAWTVALAAGAAGLLMVHARACDRGEEGQIAAHRAGPLNYLLGAALAAALALVGAEVARVFGHRLADIETPALIAAALLGAIVSLFVAIASLPAHLALRPDPVEARCEALIPQLPGEFRSLATRALDVYRQCGDALARLPRHHAREELARTLSRMTRSTVELASEWAGVEHQIEERTQRELSAEIADLERSAEAARDELARHQLRLAASSLREELERLDELTLRRERIVAKLKAEVALLERARVALISLRSGQAQIRAAGLSALARRFSALSDLQRDEAALAHEVATGAELAHHEAQVQERAMRVRS